MILEMVQVRPMTTLMTMAPNYMLLGVQLLPLGVRRRHTSIFFTYAKVDERSTIVMVNGSGSTNLVIKISYRKDMS